MSEFERITTDGTEAKRYVFTGKLVSSVTSYHLSGGMTRTYKLYETPDEYYYVVFPNGNVSIKSSASWIRSSYPELARRAGLTLVIDLDT